MDKQNGNTTHSLLGLLEEHRQGGNIPFHMPGHKRGNFAYLRGAQDIDITEIDGFDNLHDATGVIKEAQDRASVVFGVQSTHFLVNGSTCGILAGIRAVCQDGDEVLVARNSHKSVYNAIELFRLKPHYVMPSTICDGIMFGGVRADDIENILQSHPNIKLVVLTSPTYEGVISDISAIADVCHNHHALLFVDEAHGAHLGFGSFEKSARTLGADIVVNSVHKTLASLTQTALLHICSDRVDKREVERNLAIFESSSPSYILMSSIDGCVATLQDASALDKWCDAVDIARRQLSGLKAIKLLSNEDCLPYLYDKSKFVFVCSGANISGVELARQLKSKHIDIEMASADFVICMSGQGDDLHSLHALVQAVKDIDNACSSCVRDCVKMPTQLAQQAFYPCEMLAKTLDCVVFDKNCVGKICGENIWAYPPGCPVIVKGELVDDAHANYLLSLAKSGVCVSSEYKGFPHHIHIAKD